MSKIERTVGVDVKDLPEWRAFADAGATHLIVGLGPPFRLCEVEDLLRSLRGT